MLLLALLTCLLHSGRPSPEFHPAPPLAAHAPPPSAADSTERKAYRRLRSLIARARRGDKNLNETRSSALTAMVGQVISLRDGDPALRDEINLTLFEMAALGRGAEFSSLPAVKHTREGLVRLGKREIERFLLREGESGLRWVAESVLGGKKVPDGLKMAALELLRDRHALCTRQALMFTARTTTLDLREAALEALVGWDDAVVNHFFLNSLGQDGNGIQYLTRHFASFNKELRPRLLKPLLALAAKLYASDSWRDAARATHLMRCLPRQSAIPVLLDALVVWDHRLGTPLSSKRVLWEVCDELRKLSGTSLKPDPETWLIWWQGIENGRFQLPKDVSEGGQELSQASFFGLRPVTDRVLFLIDRSGSMNEVLASDLGTRYEEAVRQFLAFLRTSGPETTFSLALFSGDTRILSHGPRKATNHNLGSAHQFLLKNGPQGGTFLHQGLKDALRLGPGGRISPQRVKFDTVIVLCDGATQEGPDWVEPWLARWNAVAQLTFQCVEIGKSGDGTLKALAEFSGGAYVQVLR